ncbi:MAG TPA: hypothetical protein VHE81_14140 [Lacipirellulaceae bacterium]|nr:hypothetical protein [Lacipirellulaceae bacterium]
MAKFIISCDSIQKPLADAVTRAIASAQYDYWHWIDDFWIVQTDKVHTAKFLWEFVTKSVPALSVTTMLVARIDSPQSYWGLAPNDAWTWLKGHEWGEPK